MPSEHPRAREGPPPAADDVAVHRVIDLAAVERSQNPAASSSANAGTNTWTVDLAELEREQQEGPTAPVVTGDSAAAPAGETTSPAGSAVPRALKIATTLSLVAVLILASIAILSYRRGTAWREVALEQRVRGEQLEARIDAASQAVGSADAAVQDAMEARAAAEAAREAANGQLDTSEQDVAVLEERIATLAGEKARLEDELAVAGQTVQTEAQQVAASHRCIDVVKAWLDRAPVDGQVPSWEAWVRDSAEWERGCATASLTLGR